VRVEVPKNQSVREDIRYQDEKGLTYTEIIRQEYKGNHCIFSAGFVEGQRKPSEDTIYVRLEKMDVEPTVLLLRPDEAQILAWITTGVVWSHLMDAKNELAPT
jgi:hypothetical protein